MKLKNIHLYCIAFVLFLKSFQHISGERANGFENNNKNNSADKNPLKLVMNPHGQVQDIFSLGKQGYKFESALSPDICLSIVKDLNSPKGKGE